MLRVWPVAMMPATDRQSIAIVWLCLHASERLSASGVGEANMSGFDGAEAIAVGDSARLAAKKGEEAGITLPWLTLPLLSRSLRLRARFPDSAAMLR
jgi:hypothetical protein